MSESSSENISPDDSFELEFSLAQAAIEIAKERRDAGDTLGTMRAFFAAFDIVGMTAEDLPESIRGKMMHYRSLHDL